MIVLDLIVAWCGLGVLRLLAQKDCPKAFFAVLAGLILLVWL